MLEYYIVYMHLVYVMYKSYIYEVNIYHVINLTYLYSHSYIQYTLYTHASMHILIPIQVQIT